MKLLASVRSVEEALVAARGGADLIDCKEPGAGALGALPLPTIRAIASALRAHGLRRPVSATIGDWPASAHDAIAARVREVAATGVDWVKVGVVAGDGAASLLERLAPRRAQVVPVLIADHGLDGALVARALALGFRTLMADTADKRAGSLFNVVPSAGLRAAVAQAHEAGAQIGLAGALRLTDIPALASIGPDFAGFRSALCDGARDGALSAPRLQALRAALRRPVHAALP